MEPITLSVYDNNVFQLLKSDESNSSKANIEKRDSILDRYDSDADPNGNAHIMFPTNIKYIFEDSDNNDSTNNLNGDEANGNIAGNDDDIGIEHVIVIQLDESYDLQDIELISEEYELLSYNKSDYNGSSAIYKEDNNNINNSNQSNEIDQENKKISDQLNIEMEVVSKFKDLNLLTKDLSLEELIKLYTIQNEQIQTISNSM